LSQGRTGTNFVDFDHSLGTAINKIREALGDSAESPRFIETLPRRGYRFIAPLNEPLPDAGSSAIAKETDQPRDLQRPYAAWQPLWRRVAVGTAAVFAVAALAWEIGHHRVGAGSLLVDPRG